MLVLLLPEATGNSQPSHAAEQPNGLPSGRPFSFWGANILERCVARSDARTRAVIEHEGRQQLLSR